MPVVSPLARELVFKIVYYGPGLGGKTTTLQYVHASSHAEHRGKMVSLATPVDRTLYFDFLPVRIPQIRGLSVRLQLFTVPGQVYYNATRKLVLAGADGVVFVADSQGARADANLESLSNLRENLEENGRRLATLPHAFGYNKRDLPNILSIEELDQQLNAYAAPAFPTVATKGDGVYPTLEAITRAVLAEFEDRAPGSRDFVPQDLLIPEGGLEEAIRRAPSHTPGRASAPPTASVRPTRPAVGWEGTLALEADAEHPGLQLTPDPVDDPGEDAARAVTQARITASGLGFGAGRAVETPRAAAVPTNAATSRQPEVELQSVALRPTEASPAAVFESVEMTSALQLGAVAEAPLLAVPTPPLPFELRPSAPNVAEAAPSAVAAPLQHAAPSPAAVPPAVTVSPAAAVLPAAAVSPPAAAVSAHHVAPAPAAAPQTQLAPRMTEPAPPPRESQYALASLPPALPRTSYTEAVARGLLRDSVPPPAIGFSFGALFTPAEAGIVQEVEQNLTELAFDAALLALERLVLQILADAATALGELADAPRDPLLVLLALGLDQGRYVRFRQLLRRARAGKDIREVDVLSAFAFALELRLKRRAWQEADF